MPFIVERSYCSSAAAGLVCFPPTVGPSLGDTRFYALMPRFYFNLHNGLGFAPDEEGRELSNLEHALEEAVKGARSLLSADVLDGQLDLGGRIEVMDGQGELVSVVQFKNVLHIETGPLSTPQQNGGLK
jgi:hypothetical protein